MQPCIFLIGGIPGAGKTTISRLLAQRVERGVHIESDFLQLMIQSGRVWPNQQPVEEADRQLRLRTRNCSILADSFLEAGFTPVIDDVIISGRLQDFLDDLEGRPVLFVLLTPDLETVRQRDASRAEKHVFETWAYLDAEMRDETPSVGLWLDSSGLTAEETVDQILTEAWTRAVVRD